MKLTTILTCSLAFFLGAVAQLRYEQAGYLVPHLAPQVSDHKASTKTLITRDDKVLKNFTHDELFTLQKRFLDNFIAPNNAIQVRHSTLEFRLTAQIHKF